MSRSTKICLVVVATLLVTVCAFGAGGWLFAVPCSSGYNYRLLIGLFPFVALLGAMEVVAPGFALFLAVAQYPSYGLLVGWAWVKRKPMLALVVPVVHIGVSAIAAFALRGHL